MFIFSCHFCHEFQLDNEVLLHHRGICTSFPYIKFHLFYVSTFLIPHLFTRSKKMKQQQKRQRLMMFEAIVSNCFYERRELAQWIKQHASQHSVSQSISQSYKDDLFRLLTPSSGGSESKLPLSPSSSPHFRPVLRCTLFVRRFAQRAAPSLVSTAGVAATAGLMG